MTDDFQDFDWDAARENGSVVQEKVEPVAIYDTPEGDVVIRQGPPMFESDDVCIIIGRNNIDAVIAELRAIQARSVPHAAQVAATSKPPMSAAERQRKRRASRGVTNVTDDVTPCHADLVTDRDTPLQLNGAADV